MSPMSSWGDILTEQLGGDILMDQQHALHEGVDIEGNRWQSWVAMNTFLGLLLM